MKKTIALLLAMLLTVGLFGCKKGTLPPEKKQEALPVAQGPLVGICLPDDQWKSQGRQLEEQLYALGYQTKVVYGDNQAETQAAQIEALLNAGAQCLLITAVDSYALIEVLEQAKELQVPVIAYDRHLTDTDGVSLLVSFDYQGLGRAAGESLIAQKDLETALEEETAYTVEFFMGTPEDHTAYLFHTGLMEALQPYLDAEVLTCPSGRTSFVDVMVSQGNSAQEKCTSLLRNTYPDSMPDMICVGSSALAKACQNSAKAHMQEGMTEPLFIQPGKKDDAALAQLAATAVQTLLSGQTVATEQTVYNYMIDVPALFCK